MMHMQKIQFTYFRKIDFIFVKNEPGICAKVKSKGQGQMTSPDLGTNLNHVFNVSD